MAVIKTYRRDDAGQLHYREMWDVSGGALVHQGKVGQTGRSRTHTTVKDTRTGGALTAKQFRARFVEQAAADGYALFPQEQHAWVVLQCWLFSADLSHPCDDWIMTDGHQALDEHLGWRGLGHLDGNDIGGACPRPGPGYDGPKLNLFCKVVDGPLGVRALRGFVRTYNLPSAYVIGLREPGDEADYTLAYSPRKTDTEFFLF